MNHQFKLLDLEGALGPIFPITEDFIAQNRSIGVCTDEDIFVSRVIQLFIMGLSERSHGEHQIHEIENAVLTYTAKSLLTQNELTNEKTVMDIEDFNLSIAHKTPRGFEFQRLYYPTDINASQFTINPPKIDKYEPIIEDTDYELSTIKASYYNLPIITDTQLIDFHQYLLSTFSCSTVLPLYPDYIILKTIYIKEYKLYIRLTCPEYRILNKTAIEEYGNWPANLNIYYVVYFNLENNRVNPANDDERITIISNLNKCELVGNYVVKLENNWDIISNIGLTFRLIPGFVAFVPMLHPAGKLDNVKINAFRGLSSVFPTANGIDVVDIIKIIPPYHGELVNLYSEKIMSHDANKNYRPIYRYAKDIYPCIKIKSSGERARFEYVN